MAAVGGQTQSLHTNSLDEAIALPTDFSARIARNTQLFLQLESGVRPAPIDPWGGSYYVERLTARPGGPRADPHRRGRGAGRHGQGDRARACRKRRIEEAAARTQARIDAGRQTVVGVNRYLPDHADDIPLLKVDNSEVLRQPAREAGAAEGRARPGRGRARRWRR